MIRRGLRSSVSTPACGVQGHGSLVHPDPPTTVQPTVVKINDILETADVSLNIGPQIGRDNPLNLSISLSGGKETNKDSPSSGERRGKSPALNPRAPVGAREL